MTAAHRSATVTTAFLLRAQVRLREVFDHALCWGPPSEQQQFLEAVLLGMDIDPAKAKVNLKDMNVERTL